MKGKSRRRRIVCVGPVIIFHSHVLSRIFRFVVSKYELRFLIILVRLGTSNDVST